MIAVRSAPPLAFIKRVPSNDPDARPGATDRAVFADAACTREIHRYSWGRTYPLNGLPLVRINKVVHRAVWLDGGAHAV